MKMTRLHVVLFLQQDSSQEKEPDEEEQSRLHEGVDPLHAQRWSSWTETRRTPQ